MAVESVTGLIALVRVVPAVVVAEDWRPWM